MTKMVASNEHTPLLPTNTAMTRRPIRESSSGSYVETCDISSSSSSSMNGSNDDMVGLKVWDLVAEARVMGSQAVPVSVGYLLQMSLSTAAVIALGRVGTGALSAMALTSLFTNVTAYSVVVGMAAAIDTLCSQAFGDCVANGACRKEIGRHMARTLFVLLLLSLPMALLWLNTEPLLLLAGQDPDIAKLSARFTKWMIPSLIPFAIAECTKRFLMAQGIMRAQVFVLGLVAPFNALMQYILVISSFRIDNVGTGAPIAMTLSHTLMAILFCAYARFVEGGDAYAGWEWNHVLNFRKLRCVVKFGCAGALMTCTEWWAWEIIVLACGVISPICLAAQTIILNITVITYTIPLGFSIASGTRIGNAIGASNPNRARTIAWAAVGTGLILAFGNSAILILIRNSFLWIFTTDDAVVSLVKEIMPLAALYQTADVLGCISGGVLRGAGRPEIGAWLNVLGYYCFGIPIGFFLCFKMGLSLMGLWLGLVLALFLVGIVQVYIMAKIDWHTEAKNARERSVHQ